MTLVEHVTGFPEMMDGRVKTLHPKIHAAILADRDNPEHMRQLEEQGIEPIDMVIVNLYPFEKTIAKPDCTFEEAIEMIDIGGPCLLRAAAKNHKHVLVPDDPGDYEYVLLCLRGSMLTEYGWRSDRELYAESVFRHTSQYDARIMAYLARHEDEEADIVEFFDPEQAHYLSYWDTPGYGENPYQQAGVFMPSGQKHHPLELSTVNPRENREQFKRKSFAERGNPSLSFNNYADASAALELCAELTRAGDRLRMTGRRPVPHNLGDRPRVGHSPGDRSPAGQKDAGGPASGRSVTDEVHFRRHLPHIEKPESMYFITFRVRKGSLANTERDRVLSACRFWHGKKMTLHCACVMPDHVHLILTPFENETQRWIPLAELLKSIKNFSAREINKARGARGSLWLDENFDRVIRSEADYHEKWDYMYHNPVTSGLVAQPEDYQWFWQSGLGYGELADSDRPEVGPPVRDGAVACFIKHTNPCGSAIDADPIEAYRNAYLGDPNAAMGGILAVNFNVNAEFAEEVMETYQRWGKPAGAGGFFVEVWLAPSFDEEAVRIIRGEVEGKPQKAWGKRVRLLDVGNLSTEPDANEMDFKRIAGGVLMQTRDLVALNEEQWKVVTERQPTNAELDDLRLAWLICKHTKSNAITVCKDGTLLGNGAGQMSRVMSCRIATWLAKENGHEPELKGAAAASDAFFPFRDGPDILADAGVTAIIQPGGSKRDQEVIAACDERGVAMVFTGTRHFKH